MRTIRDIIDPDPFWVAEDAPLHVVAAGLAERQVNGAPVCARDGTVIGVISRSDLMELYGGGDDRRARDVMTPEVLAVSDRDPLEAAVRLMAFEGVHQLIVIDGRGRFAGVVTSMDVLRELAGFGRGRPRIMAVAP